MGNGVTNSRGEHIDRRPRKTQRGAQTAANAGGRIETVEEPIKRPIYHGKVEEYTKDYTPEMFLGENYKDLYIDSISMIRGDADRNMPQTLTIEGHTFKKMGEPFARFGDADGMKNATILQLDYQSQDQATNGEYPIITVGIAIRRYRGKAQAKILRKGTERTRFW